MIQENDLVLLKQAYSFNRKSLPIGRDDEKKQILQFIKDPFTYALHMCGSPGTGKTLITLSILDKLKEEYPKLTSDYFNCATDELKNETISKAIKLDSGNILILDEIDQLSGSQQRYILSLLVQNNYNFLIGSKGIKIIGISNSLDQSLLPKAKIIQFSPYNIEQIRQILEARNFNNYIQTIAIDFCARKVANTGDLRRAFSLISYAIYIAQKNSIESSINIKLPHMIEACNNLLFTDDKVGNFSRKIEQSTLHQKLLTMSLIISYLIKVYTLQENFNPNLKEENSIYLQNLFVQANKVHELYLYFFKKYQNSLSSINPLQSIDEIIDVFNNLNYNGIIEFSNTPTSRKRKHNKNKTMENYKLTNRAIRLATCNYEQVMKIFCEEKTVGSIVSCIFKDELESIRSR